jgi:hypothetical protein
MSKKRPKLEFVRIVRAKGGGPIRTVIQAVRKIPTGDFPSLKAGVALPWEGSPERHYLWICEADWDVRTFMTQPMRLEFRMSDGSMLIYFPDCERFLADNAIEIVAVAEQLRIHRQLSGEEVRRIVDATPPKDQTQTANH